MPLDSYSQRYERLGIQTKAWDWIPNRRTLRGLLPAVPSGETDPCRLPLLSVITSDGFRRIVPRCPLRNFLSIAKVNGLAIQRRLRDMSKDERQTARLMSLLFDRSYSARRLFLRHIKRVDDVRLRRSEQSGPDTPDILPLEVAAILGGERTAVFRRFARRARSTEGRAPRFQVGHALFDVAMETVANVDAGPSAGLNPLKRVALAHGPPPQLDGPTEEIMDRHMMEIVHAHLDWSSDKFNRWFFGTKDGFVEQLGRRQLEGTPIGTKVARKYADAQLHDAFRVVSHLVHWQMQAVRSLMSPSLQPDERRYWGWWYDPGPMLDECAPITLHHLINLVSHAIERLESHLGSPDIDKYERQTWTGFLKTVEWCWQLTFNRRQADTESKQGRLGGGKRVQYTGANLQ